jgi:DNA-binding response OmpR family regulator
MKKILIAEDEAIIASTLKLCLKELGYNVLKIVSTGEAAIDSLEKNNPDIVLMDINLRGEKNGHETAITMRAKNNIPIIYLSGGVPNKIEEKIKGTDPYDYLIKPFDFNILADKIKNLLK